MMKLHSPQSDTAARVMLPICHNEGRVFLRRRADVRPDGRQMALGRRGSGCQDYIHLQKKSKMAMKKHESFTQSSCDATEARPADEVGLGYTWHHVYHRRRSVDLVDDGL